MLEAAIITATKAHSGQYDKAGKPYILHPLRVMLNVNGGLVEQCVAVLHDIIEDTSITANDLLDMGFSDEIVNAVTLLTKTSEEDYMQYIIRLKNNPIACAVKLADLADNMDISRIPNPTEKDLARLEKYKKARSILLEP